MPINSSAYLSGQVSVMRSVPLEKKRSGMVQRVLDMVI
jgi:hypothetical protein